MDTLANILYYTFDNLKDNIFLNSIKDYGVFIEFKNYKYSHLVLYFELVNNNNLDYLLTQINYIIENFVNKKFYVITSTIKKDYIEFKFYYYD